MPSFYILFTSSLITRLHSRNSRQCDQKNHTEKRKSGRQQISAQERRLLQGIASSQSKGQLNSFMVHAW